MAGKNDYHWTFGANCHIKFPNGGDPVVDNPQAFKSAEGCATMSDSNGNLLFYTDGSLLYDALNAVVPPGTPLGGNSSSTHSAIIVPPAGAGSLYHVFATQDWDGSGHPHVGPVTYTAVAVSGGITIASGPTMLTGFGPQRSSEKLAAVPHRDCNKYWVISLGLENDTPGLGAIYAMRIDSDAGPSGGNTISQPYPYPTVTHGFCVKFSPDGSLLAISSVDRIDILNFDRSTGVFTAHSQVTNCTGKNRVYGLEFSPDGLHLYFSGLDAGYLNRHTIGASGSAPTPFGSTTQIGQWTSAGGAYCLGALQLGPNGKIYGAKYNDNTLIEVGDPNNPLATSAGVKFNPVATTAGGGPLTLKGTCVLGLPTFTRMTADCDDRCSAIAAELNEILAVRSHLENEMRPCEREQEGHRDCVPLDIPQIRPTVSISWGSSPCDCIEGDDTEIMYLTICNPYSNLTLSNLTVYELVVVDAHGNPVPNLPDGTPSIQLVPLGPYCFDDIAPCSCVTREFVLRLRGAPGGPYRILVKGICFDACFHGDADACFTFDVCKD